MAEYIEREALVAEFERLGLGENSLIERVFADGVYAVIECAPAVDVAPVVHGRWVKHTTDGENMFGEPIEIIFACSCSVCGLDGGYESRYCPNCGAHMGEVNDAGRNRG